jgi:hypothetical protein
MKIKIKHLEEKIKILNAKNNSEIVNFYEKVIDNFHEEEKISKIFMENLEKQNSKSLMSALIEKNEIMNEELIKYKKCERFSFVYKNLVDKAGHQIQINKKYYIIII